MRKLFKVSDISVALGLFAMVSITLFGLTNLILKESYPDSLVHPAQTHLKAQKLNELRLQKEIRIKETIKKAERETAKLY